MRLKLFASELFRCLSSASRAGVLLVAALTVAKGAYAQTEITYTGEVDEATGAFVALTPVGTPVGGPLIVDDAALAAGSIGIANIQSINVNVGGFCFATMGGDCGGMGTLVPIESIDSAAITGTGGTLGGSFQVTAFSPTFMVSIPISFDLDGGVFSADGGALGTVGGFGSLTAPSVPTPDIDTTPAAGTDLDFGTNVVGTAATDLSIDVSNLGDFELDISSVTLAGNPADLSLTEDCTAGALVALTGTCEITLTLNPATASTLNATVTITSDDPDEGSLVFNVIGTIALPAALSSDATAMPLLLDSVAIGDTSTGLVTVTNTGGVAATLGTVSMPGAPFALTANDNCSGAMLAASDSCTIEVEFAPTASGTFNDSFSVSIATEPARNNRGGGATSVTMNVTSSTLDPVASPGMLMIPDTMVNNTNDGTLTITNSGEAPLTISGASGLSAPFSSDASDCLAGPIAPMGTCDIVITFAPTVEGTAMGTLSIASDDPNSPLDVAVTALATEELLPNITLSEAMLNFATPILIGDMAMDTVTVTNTGNADLAISAIAIDPTTDFAVADDCPATLAPMGNCTLTITFAPASGGPLAATVTVESDDADTPMATVALSGTGVVPEPNIVLSTTMLDLGVESIGGSTMGSVQVTNMGTANLTISSVTIPMGDYTQTNTCEAAPLLPMGTCTVTVTFTPTVDATITDTLTLVSDDPDTMMATVSLTGRGVTAPEPNIASSTLSLDLGTGLFGDMIDGEITITNSGNADLMISNLMLGGTDAAQFMSGSDCVGTLAQGATCTVTVTFMPAAPEGAKTATLSVLSDDADTPSLDIALAGFAEMPVAAADVSVMAIDFESVTIGDSATQTVTVTSSGTGPLTVTSSALSGVADSPFSISGDTCALVAVNATCEVSITFAPLTLGDFTDSLSIVSDDPASPATVALSGTGTAVPAPIISADTDALAFGAVLFGQSSELVVTLTNDGDADLNLVTSITPMGEFTAMPACTVVMPGATCAVTVTYTPTIEGDVTAQLQLAADDMSTTWDVALTGTGMPPMPEIEFSGQMLNFGSIVAESTRVEELTVSNTGMADLVIGAVTLSGADQALFSQANNCATLAMGESCVVEVTFAPLVAGDAEATLTVVSNDADEASVDIALIGMATPVPVPMIDVAQSLEFGEVDGGMSSTQTLTVSNIGMADLVIADIALSGDGQFAQTNGCATVAPGQSCDVEVEFTPTTPGAAAATLTISSNDSGSPSEVALTGTGLIPVPMLSLAAVDLGSVAIGTNGTGTLTIGNDGNADLVITSAVLTGADATDFTLDNGCATVAQGESCTITATFTPQTVGAKMATITITTNDPAQATLTVPLTATAAPMEEVVVTVSSEGGGGSLGWLSLAGLLGLAGLARGRSRLTAATLVAALFAPMALADNHAADAGYWYVGAGFGSSDGQSDLAAIERGIEDAGVSVTSLNIDDSDSGFKVFAGYQASERIGVEVGYVDLGEAAIDLQLGDVALDDLPLISRSVSGNLSLLGSGVFGSVVVNQSITDSIGLFARVGLVSWEVDTAIGGGTSMGVLNIGETESGTDFTFGVGADAWFGEQRKFGVRGEWERFEFGNQDAEFLSLSVMYRF